MRPCLSSARRVPSFAFALTRQRLRGRVESVKVLVLQMLLCGVLLCACETVRTVYDENGNVVDTSSVPGGERDISERMEKEFNSSFAVKKTESGVPLSISNKVSSFQHDLDASSRSGKEFGTGAFAGGKNSYQTTAFAGQDKFFSAKEAYTGGLGKRIDKDLHPAFADPTRGVYGTDDFFARGDMRTSLEGRRHAAGGRSYPAGESVYSRENTSGYVETRRDNTPPPRVITRDQYYRKTIEETRTMLGRDRQED